MSVKKALLAQFFKYAAPSVVAMWVFSFYTMADGFFVAWGEGPMALASINIAMPFINFVFGLSILLSAGASTIISIYLGRGDLAQAREAFLTNLVSLIGVSVALTALSLMFADGLSLFLGASDATLHFVKTYLRIVAVFVVFFMSTYYFEVTVRADGFPKLAALSVLVAAAVNVGLDYLFVIVLRWGVAGAAWATGIAQVCSTVLLAAHFMGRRTRLSFRRFCYTPAHLIRSVRLGFGDSITEFSVGIVIFLFNRNILAVIGEEGVVSYTVMAYVTTLVVMTMSGIAQGMQPLVGYHHGKGDAASCGYLVRAAMATAVTCSLVWFLAAETVPGRIVSLFIDPQTEAGLFADTVSAFRIYATSYLFVGINVVCATYFSAIERPLLGTLVSLGRGVVFIAPILALMAKLYGGSGIWFSSTLSEAMTALLAGAAFYTARRRTVYSLDLK